MTKHLKHILIPSKNPLGEHPPYSFAMNELCCQSVCKLRASVLFVTKPAEQSGGHPPVFTSTRRQVLCQSLGVMFGRFPWSRQIRATHVDHYLMDILHTVNTAGIFDTMSP